VVEKVASAAAAAASQEPRGEAGVPPARDRPDIRQRIGPVRLVRANLYDLGRLVVQSWLTLGLFVVAVLTGAFYEHAHVLYDVTGKPYSPSWVESFYATLQLLIFQQSNQRFPSDQLGEALFFLLPVLGLLVVVQSVLNFGRQVLDKADRLQAWQVALATTYRGHVIVCGLGRLGLRVVRRLIEAGYPAVVVERDFTSDFVGRTLAMRVPVIAGDAREILTLRQAGVRRARGLIADVDGDQTNVEIALAARTAHPDIRVAVRAFSEELDASLDRIFGEDSAFSHSALAAPTIAAAAISRDIAYAIPVGGELLGITELTVQAGHPLAGTSVLDWEAHYPVRVLDRRGATGRRPRAGAKDVFQAGDRVTLLGTLAALELVRTRNGWRSEVGGRPVTLQHPTSEFNKVIVCGLGKVGYRVVTLLSALASGPQPFEVVAVYRQDLGGTFLDRIAGLPNVTPFEGDATRVETLIAAGLDRAYAVAAVTSDDLTNLETALAARGRRPDVHVVVRVFTDALADELNSIYEIHTTYSTSNLASPTLAAAAILKGVRGGGVDRAFAAAGTLFASDDFVALSGGALSGRTVGEIRARLGLLVLSLDREGRSILLPPLEARIGAGDTGVLAAPLRALERLPKR
jgi:Trk K+ transport system NAD-binding subunit